jgi:hypothetical protein
MHAMQLQQMQRQGEQQQRIDQLGPQFMRPGQPQMQPTDQETPTGPAGPGKMDWAGYSNAMTGIDPQRGLALQAQLAQMNQRNLQKLGEGDRLIDVGTGHEVASNPKHEGPKLGQTREVMAGSRTLQYEWDGKKWAKIGEGPRFKDDGPDKPPQGYRPDGNGGLTFIPGGPADPNRPGTKTQEHPTEDERRSAGLAVRLSSALKTMQDNPGAAKPELLPTAIRGATLGYQEALPNTLTSTSRQKVESAQLDALDAALTLATGAAYTKDQLQNLRKSYFPQLGDSKDTIAEKEQRFAEVIETAKIRAGRASNSIDAVLNKSPGPQRRQNDDPLGLRK